MASVVGLILIRFLGVVARVIMVVMTVVVIIMTMGSFAGRRRAGIMITAQRPKNRASDTGTSTRHPHQQNR